MHQARAARLPTATLFSRIVLAYSQLVQVSMLPGSRVVTLEEFETQCDCYKDVTAICYW